MKRIFSKKSGFTLIEIVVAFAIFAIMSTMILSMIRLTVDAQKTNNEFAASLEDQTGYLAYHYIDDAEKYDPDATSPDGAFQLNFYNSAGQSVSNISMDYATRSSVMFDEEGNANTNMGEGINYFVGNVDYADANNIQNGGGGGTGDVIPGLGNSQAARYDTRISGSRNIQDITVYSVENKTTPEDAAEGHSRYVIQCAATALAKNGATGTVPAEDVPYLQYRFRFCHSTPKDVDVAAADGKTYTYKMYDDAKIVDCGYVKGDDYYPYTTSYSTDVIGNIYSVTPTSNSVVRIGIPYDKKDQDPYTKGFQSSKFVNFYVVFDGDPGITINSFGQNATDSGTAKEFTAFPIYDENGNAVPGEFNLNIYGAYLYQKTEKVGS